MSRRLVFISTLVALGVAGCSSAPAKPVDRPELSDDAPLDDDRDAEEVETEERPPPPRVDNLVFERRPGYVWVEGHWWWTGNAWVWQPGRYVVTRDGYVYAQGRWERRGNRWIWIEGRWLAGREGYVWRRGYWQRDGAGGWVWIPGEWVSHRPGRVWRPGRWHRDDRGRWVWIAGGWSAAR